MWEGLGYYNRAKNLHQTAQLLTHGQPQGLAPTLPNDIDELIKLSGIGKNTAHAVATFAFNQPVPIMEANVKRITVNPFNYNQAMMDIGATICLPKNPKCDLCPLTHLCKGKEDPTLYPTKKKRIVPTREENILINVYDDKLSLIQRKGKFLHGLWGFESVEVPLCASEYIGKITHTYTHFKRICKVHVYYENNPEQMDYFSEEEIQKIAISKVDEKIVKLFLDTM